MSRLNHVSRIVGAAVIGLLALPGAGVAGEYRVYSCMTPAGLPAPTDGWSSSATQPVDSVPVDNCASGGPLVAELNRSKSQPANRAMVTWAWDAPPGTTIAAYRIWRSGDVLSAGEANAAPYVYVARRVNVPSGADLVETCTAPTCSQVGLGGVGLSPGNLLAQNLRAGTPATSWYVNAGCGGITGEFCLPRAGVMAMARVHAAEFTLHDPEPPTVSQVAGPMTQAAEHAGVERLSMSVSDAVSGVYRAIVEVDGAAVRTVVLDDNAGRCADAGVDPSTPYEFLHREPCPKRLQYDLSLDTGTLTDGTHAVRVVVEDAAGNRTTAWSSDRFVVRNLVPLAAPVLAPSASGSAAVPVASSRPQTPAPPAQAPTGQPTTRGCAGSLRGMSARFSRTDSGAMTARHGQTVTITGSGPRGATIRVWHLRGSRVVDLGSFRVSSTGRFSHRLKARRGSGTLRLCGPGTSASLSLKVKAKVSFRVRITRGGLVRYSGRVATGQIPKGGKIVVIQGRAGPSWQTFALRRTNSSGRFQGRYRLRVVWPGSKLQFRVRVPSEAGYPFVGVVGKALTRRVR